MKLAGYTDAEVRAAHELTVKDMTPRERADYEAWLSEESRYSRDPHQDSDRNSYLDIERGRWVTDVVGGL